MAGLKTGPATSLSIMLEYITYLAVKGVGLIIRHSPLALALWIGRRMGELNYLLNNKRRQIAYSNLKAAFSEEKEPRELLRITKGVFRNLGQTVIEILRFPSLTKDDIERLVYFESLERLDQALAKGKGVLLLSAHFGNWELSNIAMAAKGYPMKVLAKEQRHTRLNSLLNLYRESKGSKIIGKGMSIREIIRGLKANQIVGILSDQGQKGPGFMVEFFNRTTTAKPGAISLALKTGCRVLPGFMIREKGGRHRAVAERELELNSTGDEARDIQSGLQEFTTILESYIRRFPEQWLWSHRRWKSSPDRTILILSDGKAGHLRQSLAVARAQEGKWRGQDGRWRDVHYRVVEVRYKNRFCRFLLGISAFFSSSRCQGCLRCLEVCLAKSSYENLASQFADLIVSTGSRLAPVNLLMAKENMAKSVVIMKPVPFSVKRFDLAIIPEHDQPKMRRNVLVIRASPNLISEENITREAERLKAHFKLTKDLRVALLIGGDTPHFRLSRDKMEEILDCLIKAADQLDAEILVTTSRRTPQVVSELVKRKLARVKRCKLLIIANETNIDHAVEGMLGLSQMIIVSEDSISMVSEAASSGRYVIVFELDKVGRSVPKHARMISALSKEGYIVTSSSDRLFDAIIKVWREKPPIKVLEDNDKVKKRVRELL